MLSSLLVELEAHPYEPHLNRDTVIFTGLQCLAAHAKELPPHLRNDIKASLHSDEALRRIETVLFQDPALHSLAGTTQPIDLIQGGVKSNALPEMAWAVVNHRIAVERWVSCQMCAHDLGLDEHVYHSVSSLAKTMQRDTDLLRDVAERLKLNFSAFGTPIMQHTSAAGTLTLTNNLNVLFEPVPEAPTDFEAVPWRILSGTIKATYNINRGIDGANNIIVSPSVPSGNTGELCLSPSD